MNIEAYSPENLSEMTMGELITAYNQLTGEEVKRFKDKGTGIARVRAAVAARENTTEAEEAAPAAEEAETGEASAEAEKPARGRRSKRAGLRLQAASDQNPHRSGSWNHRTFEMIKAQPGITYEEALEQGARRNGLNYDLRMGYMVEMTDGEAAKAA